MLEYDEQCEMCCEVHDDRAVDCINKTSADTVARIVAWLRDYERCGKYDHEVMGRGDWADAIEREFKP